MANQQVVKCLEIKAIRQQYRYLTWIGNGL
jgi:hypothetical protein